MPDFFAPRGQRFVPSRDIPDLTGQVYIITGASTGLGFAIAAHLLAHNASKIITLSSRRAAALESIQKLSTWGDVSKVTWRECNLSSLSHVDAVSQAILAEEPRIDAIILNAAVGITAARLSRDGIDDHFQVNMLAQLHLALTLLPTLHATAQQTGYPARLVFMSSATHQYAPKATRFESLTELNEDLGKQDHYYRSKLAQILVVRQLAQRLEKGEFVGVAGNTTPDDASSISTIGREKHPSLQGKGWQAVGAPTILVNAAHPGDYNKTPLTDNLKNAFGILGWILLLFLAPFMSDPMTEGCLPALFASTPNKELLEKLPTGSYIVPSKRIIEPAPRAKDDAGLGQNVWKLSLGLLEAKLSGAAVKGRSEVQSSGQ